MSAQTLPKGDFSPPPSPWAVFSVAPLVATMEQFTVHISPAARSSLTAAVGAGARSAFLLGVPKQELGQQTQGSLLETVSITPNFQLTDQYLFGQ